MSLLSARRSRVESLRDPSRGLHGTHILNVGAVDAGAIFPGEAKNQPVTFGFTVICGVGGTIVAKISGDAASDRGLGVRISGGDLTLEAGAGTGTAADNILTTVSDAVPLGVQARIVVSAIPNLGAARVWVNGSLVIRGQSSSGDFGSGWTD